MVAVWSTTILRRPVAAMASRSTSITASLPELVNRLVLVRKRHRLELTALPSNGIRHRAVAVAVDQRGVVEQQIGTLITINVHQHLPVR